MKLHIDKIGYNNKPSDSIPKIKNRLQKVTTTKDITLPEIMNKLLRGYTISPGVMTGTKAEHWIEQQLFLVDIDNKDDGNPIQFISDALDICEQNNFPPAFYYLTYSHTEQIPRFRLCFVMDEVITYPGIRALIMETLIGLFSRADSSCSNADRVFFGTNNGVVPYKPEATISLDAIISFAERKPRELSKKLPHTGQLDHLIKEFDFKNYLQERNEMIHRETENYVMFENCEICGHKRDLVYYKSSNTFCCFGDGGKKVGTIIKYLELTEKLSTRKAIEYFKYTLCRIPRNNINTPNVEKLRDITNRLTQLKAHENYSLNDKGFGSLFADVFKDYARYNSTSNQWYFYNGKFWEEDKGAMNVSRKAKELFDALLMHATSIQDEHFKNYYLSYVFKLGQFRYRETMIKDARDKYFVEQTDFDTNVDLLNCQNGTYNLKNFTFLEHNPNDLLSKISNIVYDPFAKSPLFEKFIIEIMLNDKEKIEYLKKIMGYSLTTDTSLETMFIFHGATTRNGKSTLIETFSYMLGNNGGYSMTIQPQTLAYRQNKDSRQASGDIARLNGYRFLNASEPPKRMIFDASLLKTLLGRDSITARHLHESEFEFTPCFKLIMNTNHLPLIQDDTLFTSGRINVISFERHFTPNEQDKHLKDKLQQTDNLSGVFNWCIEGLRQFRKEGAIPPKTVVESTNDYQKNSDKIGNFINDCMVKSNANTKAGYAYEVYKSWCEENGYGIENKSIFFDELRGKNIFVKISTVNGKSEKNVVVGHVIKSDSIK